MRNFFAFTESGVSSWFADLELSQQIALFILAALILLTVLGVIVHVVKERQENKRIMERYRRQAQESRELYHKQQVEKAAYLRTPEGQQEQAENRRKEDERARIAHERRVKQTKDSADAKAFYESLDSTTQTNLKKASKSERENILQTELSKARKDGVVSDMIDSSSVISIALSFSAASPTASSSSSDMGTVTGFDSGSFSSFDAGGFSGGGDSGSF